MRNKSALSFFWRTALAVIASRISDRSSEAEIRGAQPSGTRSPDAGCPEGLRGGAKQAPRLLPPSPGRRIVGNWFQAFRARSAAILVTLIAFFFLGTFSVSARDHQLWGAVLLGKNGAPPKKLPSELQPHQKQLSRVFGYETFEVLGKSSRTFSDESEQWLIPGKSFSVRSVVKATDDANFRVELQLYQGKKELVQTVAKLGPRSPLFIRGPLYGKGQLVIAIMVRDEN